MPANVVKSEADEKHWTNAKAAADKEGKSKDWPYVMSIFESMSGKKKKQGSPVGKTKGDAMKAAAKEAMADKM